MCKHVMSLYNAHFVTFQTPEGCVGPAGHPGQRRGEEAPGGRDPGPAARGRQAEARGRGPRPGEGEGGHDHADEAGGVRDGQVSQTLAFGDDLHKSILNFLSLFVSHKYFSFIMNF